MGSFWAVLGPPPCVPSRARTGWYAWWGGPTMRTMQGAAGLGGALGGLGALLGGPGDGIEGRRPPPTLPTTALRPSWDRFGAVLVPSWRFLGAILGSLGAVLGSSWAVFGPPGRCPGPPGEEFGVHFCFLFRSWLASRLGEQFYLNFEWNFIGFRGVKTTKTIGRLSKIKLSGFPVFNRFGGRVWIDFGSILETKTTFFQVLEASWEDLGPSWGILGGLGRSWSVLEPSWGCRGPS